MKAQSAISAKSSLCRFRFTDFKAVKIVGKIGLRENGAGFCQDIVIAVAL